jgi:hypothetical protein
MTWRLKAGILERIDAAIARHLRGKHVSASADTDATIEDEVFSVRSVPRLYNEDQLDQPQCRQSVGGRSRRLAVLGYIVSSRYLAMTSDERVTNRRLYVLYVYCSCTDL